jgi:type I restriction enzyme M protein
LRGRAITAVDCSIIRFDPQRFIANLFPYYTQSAAYYRELDAFLTGASRSRISRKNLEEIQIPLPPLEVQQEIVAEIEGYQKVINGARAVLDNYRPQIPIDPAWPMVELGEAAEVISGYAFKGADMTEAPAGDNCRRVVKIGNVGRDGRLDISDARFHAYTDEFARFVLRVGDIVMAMTGATVGKVADVKDD